MHCVDLGESFPTSIYFQKSASIQPRTSPSKSGGKYSILFNRVLNPNSVRMFSKLQGIRSRLYRSKQANRFVRQAKFRIQILVGIGNRFVGKPSTRSIRLESSLETTYMRPFLCTFGIQFGNHQKRFFEASSARKTLHRRRNNQTAAGPGGKG